MRLIMTLPTNYWASVGDRDPELWLASSVSNFVQTKPESSIVFYQFENSDLQQKTIPNDSTGNVFAAIIGSTVFIARGRYVYTVGSLNVLEMVFDLGTGVASGVWADDTNVWVATDKGTCVSRDLGWTWTLFHEFSAAGPGWFTKTGSDNVWGTSDLSFAQEVPFPLRLNNSGLLYKEGGWANWFQETPIDTTFTEIKETDTHALSPNGRYLVTIVPNGVALYLNVWNSARFAAWCRQTSDGCRERYGRYCNEFKTIDDGCKTDTPGPDSPNEGLSTLTIVLISLAGLGVVAAILYAVLKKRKARSFASPTSSPISSGP
jgi:hypothetical protein